MRKYIVAIFVVLLALGGLGGIKAMQFKKLMAASASFAPPPETISSSVAAEAKWQGTLTAIGSIASVQGVDVTTEVAGLVQDVPFESGATVKKGDLLVKLDTSSEEAQLRAIEAQLELANLNLERSKKLRADNMVSQSDLDTADATVKQTLANADALRTMIAKKTIRAPFAGKLGIRLINVGQYLDLGKPIVSLQSLAPIYADFSLPQHELARLKPGMTVRVQTDAYTNTTFVGTLSAINPDLDPATRSIGLQATFENKDQLLRPGMFAQIEVLLPEEKNVLTVPLTSILSAPYGDSVFVLEQKAGDKSGDFTVRQQFVRVGAARGDFISVESGLKAGDKVVSAGVFKLRNGMAVKENNDIVPKAAVSPKPADS